ncbi:MULTISPECIES: GNAT family N-acetyltransferase [Pseudomonas]|uniref:GNAT family protein n=1 Tax=Pseudomonas spirodelae TaxID=3101751 RepID=A0ABU5P6Y1_9PSED|nr:MULTISPECIES: GNAT family protein [unclassified Pseudomonas]MBU0901514.1 GNAT family N-acetyltransferase [Gammaproteobacteria bacterium]MDD2159311.1 GNAT family protein [Pseudomonas sp. MIL19]MEA1605441.1 GNAT family protein [Pseudomonas sp. T5W1]
MFKPQLITLQRGGLRIEPMVDADIPALVSLAEANRAELVHMNGTQRLDWYREGLLEQREGRALPFVIRLDDQLVGTTRFADFVSSLPAAEIGWTWLDSSQHGTGLNTLIKYLMLKHAFESWRMVRVQLKTAASNLRSQRAIEKLGALREGVLRNHRRLADGRLDDTVLYSITDHDWPVVKQQLEARFSG